MKGVATLLLLSTVALAHDHNAPELDQWYKSLRNDSGMYCCDGSDAYSVNDPDWTPNPDEEYPYKVKVRLHDGTLTDYLPVHKQAVVKGSILTGVAKVW